MLNEHDKIKTADLKRYLEESRGLERDYIGEILKSRKSAWRITIGMGLITLFALAAAVAGTRRPSPPPVVLRVDNATGAVDVVTTMLESINTYGEVVDIYWLNKYVLNRESYDYSNIQMLYDTTALLSTPEVQQEYHAIFQGAEARDKVLGENTRIITTVRSITPDKNEGNATVRFTTQVKNANGTLEEPKHLIATISYEYTNMPISSEDRKINPLGFQVISYRVDPEFISY